jgi:hypothetical protein
MNHLLECPDLFGVGDIAKQCLDRLDNERNNIINYRYFSDVNVFGKLDSNGNIIQSSVPTEISNEYGQGVGAVTFDNGNIYRNPIVTLTINADKLGVYRSFGKADIMIFEDFLSAKKEFYKYVLKREKKEGIESDSMTFSNIAFARIIVELNYYDGYLTDEKGNEISIDGNDFYCKKFRSGRVRFRGFDRKARALLYSYYKNSKKKK